MSFTCFACKVLFIEADVQRDHYKSDWHRYNLKRKVAELPPVTKDAFEIRVAAHNAETNVESAKDSSCEICHKRFSSENAMTNHMQSKKHLEAVIKSKDPQSVAVKEPQLQKKAKYIDASKVTVEEMIEVDEADDDSDWESCNEDENDDDDTSIPNNICLFCSFESESADRNVEHMTEAHSFFVPDIEYVCNLYSLLTFLGHKVGNGYLCLWCDRKGKSFKSMLAAQKHMIDKGHCKMLHEGEALLSYADFYDYSASYPDASGDNADEEVNLDMLQNSSYELVLPSGATIGHRSLAIYYKQNLRPLAPENSKAIRRIMQHYKALGWTGTTGEAAVRKAKDLRYLRKIQSKHALRLGMQKNRLQTHYRPQIQL